MVGADVKPYKNAGKRRDLYLDLEQRRALLAASHGALRDLLEAAMLTGARAGELDVARLVGTSVMMIEKHYGHLVHSVARERLALVVMT
jgi:hypothetical protein